MFRIISIAIFVSAKTMQGTFNLPPPRHYDHRLMCGCVCVCLNPKFPPTQPLENSSHKLVGRCILPNSDLRICEDAVLHRSPFAISK